MPAGRRRSDASQPEEPEQTTCEKEVWWVRSHRDDRERNDAWLQKTWMCAETMGATLALWTKLCRAGSRATTPGENTVKVKSRGRSNTLTGGFSIAGPGAPALQMDRLQLRKPVPGNGEHHSRVLLKSRDLGHDLLRETLLKINFSSIHCHEPHQDCVCHVLVDEDAPCC